MLKNLHKHLHKHPIIISLITIFLIFTIVALPLILNKNTKDSSDTKKFIQIISGNSQSSIVSSQVSSVISSSIPAISSSAISTSVNSSSMSEILKVIEEVKPVFIQPILPIRVENIEPQNNVEEVYVAPVYTPVPKSVIQETPKPILQSIAEPKPEPKPVVAPAPIIEVPKPTIDNFYTATGCDQSLANQMLNIVNNHRATNGARALSLSSQLIGIACAHSQWMTNSGIFSHTGRDNTSPFERCKKAGSYCYAENVAYNTIPDVQDLFDQFKNSPGHNLNMLDPNFVEIGIAFDGIYVTQIFR
jgi:uncharacterized protein YkwD